MKIFFFFIFVFGSLIVKSQTEHKYWKSIKQNQFSNSCKRKNFPKKYLLQRLEHTNLKSILFSISTKIDGVLTTIELPMPNDSLEKFSVVESSIMAPELAAQFPEIKTFNIKGISNPYSSGKLDWNSNGLHASIKTLDGEIYIDPYCDGNTKDYIVYYTSDLIQKKNSKKCATKKSRKR